MVTSVLFLTHTNVPFCFNATSVKYWKARTLVRSSRPKVFCKKGVLRNFTKFTGKHLYQSLFLNKVAGLRPATLLKKRLWHRYFPVNFAKFLRAPFLTEHLWWLLLRIWIQNRNAALIKPINCTKQSWEKIF